MKGLVAMDLDGTRDKLVVAFDVDANRQHNIVMKYNVQVQKILSTDSRLHYLWSICLIQLIRWIHLI